MPMMTLMMLMLMMLMLMTMMLMPMMTCTVCRSATLLPKAFLCLTHGVKSLSKGQSRWGKDMSM